MKSSASESVKNGYLRGIEWSLRAFASMRAVCLFLRACEQCVYFCEHASSCQIFLASSEHFRNTDGEQRALRKIPAYGELRALRVLRKFSTSRNLSFINRIRCFAPSNR